MFGLGRIFRKKREDDFDDLRSHVLGDKFSPENEIREDREDFTPRTREAFPAVRRDMAPPSIEPDPEFSRYDDAQRDDFAPAPDFSLRRTEKAAEKVNRDYDIMERLSMIENQIAVVRSQTETINERLKNLDARLNQGQRRF